MNRADGADPDRRRLLGTLATGALAMLGPARAVAEPGVIPYHGGRISPPLPMPTLPLQLADGTSTDMATLLRGRATALHLMFTGCTTTCPIQGVVFNRVQRLLHGAAAQRVQLLSLSINPLDDTPAAMRAWLAHFEAGPGWIAARPEPQGLDAIARLFGTGSGSLADHATSVSLINTRGMLVWRTYELPSPESLAEMLNQA